MSQQGRFDYIIAGAGASGLTLLYYLLQQPATCDKNILVIDRTLKPTNSKTWCFWDDGLLPVQQFIYHTWNSLTVQAHQNKLSEELKQYRYHCVRSEDYSRELILSARSKPNIIMIETGINSFYSDDEFGYVKTENGTYCAPYIFQSVLKPTPLPSSISGTALKQHFTGWEIETNNNLFDPDNATLMDFDISQQHGFSFFYMLPFTPSSMLVEYTLFTEQLLTKAEYETEIARYLKSKFNLDKEDYSIIRKETGSIPMEDKRYSPWYCSRVLNMGSIGGYTKPSTGYTFVRIHQQAQKIASFLSEGRPLIVKPASSYRFRVYDIMLLYLLKNDPEISVTIFHDLFKNNSFDRILTFLDEDTTIFQELSIFSSLPYMPFFKSIYKMKHRIFTGA